MKAKQSIDQAFGMRRVEACESRLALSASLAGELLVDALSASGLDTDLNVDGQDSAADLVAQAEQIRAVGGPDGSGQSVVVIDSGVAWDHKSLGSGFGPGYRVVAGWDFAHDDPQPYDDGPSGYHGTHVAGLLAGEGIGVAPGADLIALRVFDDAGSGKLEWIESALQWVHTNQNEFDSPITTVNLSIGAALNADNQAEAVSMLSDELQQLRDDGILVFAAAGNSFQAGESGVLYPASDPNVVAVSAVDDDGELSDYAQRQSDVFATRGTAIESAIPEHVFGWDGSYDDQAALDGTSVATPQVAAASMLVRQSLVDQGIEPTPELILQRLSLEAEQRVDSVTDQSYQVVDLLSAVQPITTEEVQVIDEYRASDSADALQLSFESDSITLETAGGVFVVDQNSSGPIVIDAGPGADSLQIVGSEQAERLIAYGAADKASVLSTNSLQFELRGFEQIEFDGGGGPDQATLYDTRGDDVLKSRPGSAELEGVGFRIDVTSVDRIMVHATGGGDDVAYLQDSPVDDQLAVRPQFTSMRGDGRFQLAYGFEEVYAYSSAGGDDIAEIYDSEGDDLMTVLSTRTSVTGQNYSVSARGFGSIIAHAVAGGDDLAKLYIEESDGHWDVTTDRVQWTSQAGYERTARQFERVEAFQDFERIDLEIDQVGLDILSDPDEAKTRGTEAIRQVFDDFGSA